MAPPLSLRINLVTPGQTKTIPFDPAMTVGKANSEIRSKLGPIAGGQDHSLYLPTTKRWMKLAKQLQFYELKANDTVEFRKRHTRIRVRLLDESVKVVMVDDSLSVKEVALAVSDKFGIGNPEEYSLGVERGGGSAGGDGKKKDVMNASPAAAALGKKSKGSEEGMAWLHPEKGLSEQDVHEGDMVILKKKFFFSDATIDRNDPVQLNLVYVQARDDILSGKYPTTAPEAIQFAAIQRQAQYGNDNKAGPLKACLPEEYWKLKDAEKKIVAEQGKLLGMSELNAKFRYVQLCRSLHTYGVSFFLVKEKDSKKHRMVTRLIGVAKDAITRFDAETKEVLKTWPLTSLRRWAASPNSFTLDFGDYQDAYYSVMTHEGDEISQLISGYIEIILKRKKMAEMEPAEKHLADQQQQQQEHQGVALVEEWQDTTEAAVASVHTTRPSGAATQSNRATPAVVVTNGQSHAINGTQDHPRHVVQVKPASSSLRPEAGPTEHALFGKLQNGFATTEAACSELKAGLPQRLPEFEDDLQRQMWMTSAFNSNVQVVRAQCVAHLASCAAVLNLAEPTSIDEQRLSSLGGEISTLTSTIPLITGNIRTISALERGDLASEAVLEHARNLGKSTLQYLNAIQNVVAAQYAVTMMQKLPPQAQAVCTAAEALMKALQCQLTLPDRQAELRTKAQSVIVAVQELVSKAKLTATSSDNMDLRASVLELVKSCSAAASRFVACVHTVLPVISSPLCITQLEISKTALLAAAQKLLKPPAPSSPNAADEYSNRYANVEDLCDRVLRMACCSHLPDPLYHFSQDSPDEDALYRQLLERMIGTSYWVSYFQHEVRHQQSLDVAQTNVEGSVSALVSVLNTFQDRMAGRKPEMVSNVREVRQSLENFRGRLLGSRSQLPDGTDMTNGVQGALDRLYETVQQCYSDRDLSEELEERLLSAAGNCIISSTFIVGACTMANAQTPEDGEPAVVSKAMAGIRRAVDANSSLILATRSFSAQRTPVDRDDLMETAAMFLSETEELVDATASHSQRTRDYLLQMHLNKAIHQSKQDRARLRHVVTASRLFLRKPASGSLLLTRLAKARERLQRWNTEKERLAATPLASKKTPEELLIESASGVRKCLAGLDDAVAASDMDIVADRAAELANLLEELADVAISAALHIEQMSVQGQSDPIQANEMQQLIIQKTEQVLHSTGGAIETTQRWGSRSNAALAFENRSLDAKRSLSELIQELPSRRALKRASMTVASVIEEPSNVSLDDAMSPIEGETPSLTLELAMSRLSTCATSLTVASKNLVLACRGTPDEITKTANELELAFQDLVLVVRGTAQLSGSEKMQRAVASDLQDLSAKSIHLLNAAKSVAGIDWTEEARGSLLEATASLGQAIAKSVQTCSSILPATGEFAAAFQNVQMAYEKVTEGLKQQTAGNSRASMMSVMSVDGPLFQEASYPASLREFIGRSRALNSAWLNVLSLVRTQEANKMSTIVLDMSRRLLNVSGAMSSALLVLYTIEDSTVSEPDGAISATIRLYPNAQEDLTEILQGKIEFLKACRLLVEGQTREEVLVSASAIGKAADVLCQRANDLANDNESDLTDQDRTNFGGGAQSLSSAMQGFVPSVKTYAANSTLEEKQRCIESTGSCMSSVHQLGALCEDVLKRAGMIVLTSQRRKRIPQSSYPQTIQQLIRLSQELVKSNEGLLKSARSWSSTPEDGESIHALNAAGRDVAGRLKVLTSALQAASPGEHDLQAAIGTVQSSLSALDATLVERSFDESGSALQSGDETRQVGSSTLDLVDAEIDVLLSNVSMHSDELVGGANTGILERPRAARCLKKLAESFAAFAGKTLSNQERGRASGRTLNLGLVKRLGEGVLAAAEHYRSLGLGMDEDDSAELREMPRSFTVALDGLRDELSQYDQVTKPFAMALSQIDEGVRELNEDAEGLRDSHTTPGLHLDREIIETVTSIMKSVHSPEKLSTLAAPLSGCATSYAIAFARELQHLGGDSKSPVAMEHANNILGASRNTVIRMRSCALNPESNTNRSNLSTAARELSNHLRASLSAMKGQASACDDAIQRITDQVVIQIDADLVALEGGGCLTRLPTSEVGNEEEHDERVRQQSRLLVDHVKNLITATSASMIEVGKSANGVYDALNDLKVAARAMCAVAHVPQANQKLLEQIKGAAYNIIVLIRQAGKTSSDKSGKHDNDVKAMAETARSIGGNVGEIFCILDTIRENRSASASKASALEAAGASVAESRSRLSALDTHITDQTLAGNGEEEEETFSQINNIAKSVATVTVETAQAASSVENTAEEMQDACHSLSAHIEKLVQLTESIWVSPSLTNQRERLRTSIDNLCGSLFTLLRTLCSSGNESEVSIAVRKVANSVNEVVNIAGHSALEVSRSRALSDRNSAAEQELNAAAMAIEAASEKLSELRTERAAARAAAKSAAAQKHGMAKDLTNKDFHECLLDAAHSIAQASVNLVRAATLCQREICVSSKHQVVKEGDMYFSDGTWSEGLVSAARTVVDATQELCKSTDAFVKGDRGYEMVVASAREVGGATARLISAAGTRADPSSQSQVGLRNAGKKVQSATESLVKAAQDFHNEEEGGDETWDDNVLLASGRRGLSREMNGSAPSTLSSNKDKVFELEAQAEIARMEKELEKARNRLAQVRKRKYQQQGGATVGGPGGDS